MLVVKSTKIRSSNGSTVRIPTRPFVVPTADESESMGVYLLPATQGTNPIMGLEGYHPPLLYVHERFVDVVSYESRTDGILEVSSRYSKRSTSLLYVPESNDLPIFGVGAKADTQKAFKMLRSYNGQDAHIAFDGTQYSIRAIETAFPNDHWIYSFEDEDGYIQSGILYGKQINLDTLTPQIRTKGTPNQVGIFVSAQGMRMKIRVLNDGIQFYEIIPKHLITGHPELGNPWPYIVSVLQRLSSI